MNKSVKGSLTEANLLKSFAGESQAKNRYTFFSEVAKKEGYEQIAGIFYETALQEEMHAKRFFSRLEGGMLEITAAYPAGVILDTASNLVEAAEGEYDVLSYKLCRSKPVTGQPATCNYYPSSKLDGSINTPHFKHFSPLVAKY